MTNNDIMREEDSEAEVDLNLELGEESRTEGETAPLLPCTGNNNKDDNEGYVELESDTSKISCYGSSSSPNTIDTEQIINIPAQILSLALPALLALAVDPFMTLIDTAFVGRYSGTNALSGLGSSAALITFVFYIFNFLCTATTPLVSERRSAGDAKGAVSIGGQALSLALLLGGTLTILLLAFDRTLLGAMGTEMAGPEATKYALDFLHVRSFAAPAVFVTSAATGILRGYLDTKTSLLIVLFANVINFIIDVITIPILGMGPMGAAIATTASEWTCALLFLAVLGGYLPAADDNCILGKRRKSETDENSHVETIITPVMSIPTASAMRPLLVASSSVFVRSLALQLTLAGAASAAARSASTTPWTDGTSLTDTTTAAATAAATVAAHQIALQIWLLGSFLCDALAAAAQTLVADAVGRDDNVGVRSITIESLKLSLVLGVFLSILLHLGIILDLIPETFTSDPVTINALSNVLNLIVILQPLNSFVFVADGVVQGLGLFGYQARCMLVAALSTVGWYAATEGKIEWFSEWRIPGMTSLGSGESGNDGSGGWDFLGVTTGAGAGVGAIYGLDRVWMALAILQLIRGITSLWKLSEPKPEGLIDLFGIGRTENGDRTGER